MTDTDYRLLRSQLEALIGEETDPLANASNFVALLYNALDDVNWLGIYVLRQDELVLGPSRANRPVCASRSAAVFAGRRPRLARPSSSPTYTLSPGTSSAMPTRDRK